MTLEMTEVFKQFKHALFSKDWLDEVEFLLEFIDRGLRSVAVVVSNLLVSLDSSVPTKKWKTSEDCDQDREFGAGKNKDKRTKIADGVMVQ